MRRIITIVFILAVSVMSSSAQGRFIVGGHISYSSGKEVYNPGDKYLAPYEMNKRTYIGPKNFAMGPSFHYMVSSRLALGTEIGFTFTREQYRKDNDNKGGKTYSFSLIPSAIYYVSLSEKFSYTPQFGIGWIKPKSDDTYRYNTFFTELMFLSFEFRPTKGIGLNLAVGGLSYQMERARQKWESNNRRPRSKNQTFRLDIKDNLGLAMRFYL